MGHNRKENKNGLKKIVNKLFKIKRKKNWTQRKPKLKRRVKSKKGLAPYFFFTPNCFICRLEIYGHWRILDHCAIFSCLFFTLTSFTLAVVPASVCQSSACLALALLCLNSVFTLNVPQCCLCLSTMLGMMLCFYFVFSGVVMVQNLECGW